MFGRKASAVPYVPVSAMVSRLPDLRTFIRENLQRLWLSEAAGIWKNF